MIGGGVLIAIVVALLVLVVIPSRRSEAEQLEAATGDIVTAFIGDLSASAAACPRLRQSGR